MRVCCDRRVLCARCHGVEVPVGHGHKPCLLLHSFDAEDKHSACKSLGAFSRGIITHRIVRGTHGLPLLNQPSNCLY